MARVERRWEDREGGGAGPDHRGLHTAVLSSPSQWSTGRASSSTTDPAIYGPRNASRRAGRGGGAERTSAKSGGKMASGLPSKHTSTGAAPSPNTPLQGAPSLTPAWRARRRGHRISAWTPVHSEELTSYMFHPYRGQRLGNAPHLCPIVRGRKAAAQAPTLMAKGECHGTRFSSERDGMPLQLCPPCRQSVRGLCFAEGAAGQRPHRAQISLGTDSHVQWEHRSFKSPSVFASRISQGGGRMSSPSWARGVRAHTHNGSEHPKSRCSSALPSSRRSGPPPRATAWRQKCPRGERGQDPPTWASVTASAG